MDKVVRKNYPQVIKEIEDSAKDKYMKLWVKNKGDLVRGVLK